MSTKTTSRVSQTKTIESEMKDSKVIEFQTMKPVVYTQIQTTAKLEYIRFDHLTRSVHVTTTITTASSKNTPNLKSQKPEVILQVSSSSPTMLSTLVSNSVFTTNIASKIQSPMIKVYALFPLLLMVCLVCVFIWAKRKNLSLSHRHRRHAQEKTRSLNSLTMGHGPSDEVMYAIVKMASTPLVSLHSSPTPSINAEIVPPTSVEHYSTVCDAVDLATPIYDEPPPTFSLVQRERSTSSECCDLHYQPIDASPQIAPSSYARLHQYDSVYIPIECEHGMHRRIDSGGYVKCRRPPQTDTPNDATVNRMNPYERLDYSEARPVLPLRRESLPRATVPPLPPRSSRDSNVYERIDLTQGCPMLRPLSVASREITSSDNTNRTTDTYLPTVFEGSLKCNDLPS